MSKNKFLKIKNKRYFYVFSYRNILNTLIFLGICNLIFLGVATFLFFTRGMHTYFATSGYSNPQQLTPIDGPNYSSQPLLQDDIPSDEGPDMSLLR
jgi:intracellular multiplication protein IcmM